MVDYGTLIDAEIWAFIRKTEQSYPDDAVSLDIAGQRRVYDAMCRAFYRGRPAGIGVEDSDANGVPVRIYAEGSPNTTVVYFHGGGFVVGGLDSHDDVCAEICAQTGFRVVAVDYRLAPEHKHPAAFDDAWAATSHVAEAFGQDIVLVGDSAGGNLAAAVAHHARGRSKRIRGVVLIYPGLGGDATAGSYVEHAAAPMLTTQDCEYYQSIRVDGDVPSEDPRFAPLGDRDFSGLPPTAIFTAECDPLASDGPAYAAALTAARGRAHCTREAGLVHGYLRARGMSARASDSFERITVAIEALGQGIWPYD